MPHHTIEVLAADAGKKLHNGSPGDLVFVCPEPGLAAELRACGFKAIDEAREGGRLEEFVNRRRVIVAYRDRASHMAAAQAERYLAEKAHPQEVGRLDLAAVFYVDRPFAEWWLDQISEGQYDSGIDFEAAALERAMRTPGMMPEAWPELSFEDCPEVLPFPADVFPRGLAMYLAGVSEMTLSPDDMAGCAMLATASAAIGRSVSLHLKSTWRESTQMYLVLIADPGKSKTPPQRLVVKPLTRIDTELRAASERENLAWEDQKKNLTKGQPTPPRPSQRRAIVKDITRESLTAILKDNPRGVLADPDEATGWVGSFNEYKGKGTDRQFWLSIHNGDPISTDREGGRRSSHVPNPLATVLGGMTPDMIGALSEEQGRNDGFIDRILFSFPDFFPDQRWIDEDLDAALSTIWDAAIRRLHAQAMYYDADRDQSRPWVVDFSPDAKREWVAWFNAHCRLMEAPDAPHWLPGTYSKLRGYCARLALILSRLRLAIDPESDLAHAPVSAEDMRGAIRLVDYFKSHVAKLHHRRTGGTGSRDADLVLGWIRRKGVSEFRENDVRRDLKRRLPTSEVLRDALAKLYQLGAIRPVLEPAVGSKPGPKPTPLHEVNPALLSR